MSRRYSTQDLLFTLINILFLSTAWRQRRQDPEDVEGDPEADGGVPEPDAGEDCPGHGDRRLQAAARDRGGQARHQAGERTR